MNNLINSRILKLAAVICLLVFARGVYAQTRNFYNIDTPTAFTADKGAYDVSLLLYDMGGVEFKALVGLASFIHLGVSWDVQNAIGKENMMPNIPGVIGRIKFTDGWESWPISIAAGYDSFFMGWNGLYTKSQNRHNRVIFGPHLIVTKPIYLFDDEQYISAGVRTPTQPDYVPNDTSYYLSVDFPLNSAFRLKGELERVFWNFRKPDEWLYNLGVRYTHMQQFAIEFDFLFSAHERCNRVIRIEYYDHF
jgi:hypothetical protein